jgi:nitrite reductase (NO-forming)
VRVGDSVEIKLTNKSDSQFPHNIVIHGLTRIDEREGGTITNPGESNIFTFKAAVPGLFIYHCDADIPNIPSHMANGMYGVILVEPEKGLSEVDKEFYIVESGFFTQHTDKPGIFELSMEKGLSETPDYVVFNGHVGSLTDDNALNVKPGKSVRIYFANIGTSGISSLNISGEIFRKVYIDGAIEGVINNNVQALTVPAGGATIVEIKAENPTTIYLSDHNFFRISKGAVAAIKISGSKE